MPEPPLPAQPASPSPDSTKHEEPTSPPMPANTEPPTAFDISQEIGTGEKNLPPGKIVAICLGILAVLIIIFIFLERPTASASGSINNVTAVTVPNENSLLVAINVSFRNNSKQPFWIHSIKADLVTADGTYSETGASALDFDRYFQAFPTLKQNALPALKPEDRIAPGAEDAGTIIVGFPVTMDAFNSRKSLTVTIWPYDQEVPLIMKK
jgi:hypothetical protein